MGGYPLNNPAYYAKAAETAREVIDNADFYGFGLVDDFANLWQWQYHDNKELVWSIYYQGETFNFNSMLKFKYSHKKITTEKNYFRNFPNNYRKHISFWHYRFVESYEQDDFREEPNNRIFLVFNDATFDESDDFKCNVYGCNFKEARSK